MQMTRDEAKEYCKGQLATFLKAQGKPTNKKFECYRCGHKAMSYYPSKQQIHCFHCETYFDIFDLIGEIYGISDTKAVFDRTYQELGIEIVGSNNTSRPVEKKEPAAAVRKEEPAMEKKSIELNIEEQIQAAHEALLCNESALKHFTDRGISKETIERYRIGYSTEGHNAILKNYPQLQTKSKKADLYKYVFPYIGTTGKVTYFTTEITDRDKIDEYNGKYRLINKPKDEAAEQLPAQLFNERYLYEDIKEPVFICEGIFDALSVEEAGGRAIALNGVGHNRLLTICKERKPAFIYLFADADEAGQQAAERIEEGLKGQGIPFTCIKNKAGKDANEALIADRETFIEKVQEYISDAKYLLDREEEEARQEYLNTNAGSYIDDFIKGIRDSVKEPYYPTGFNNIDKLIDEGLRAGLYTIGAISSLGKTTFTLQIADYVAKCGYDVLFFSLEMARKEIMAKSISRETMAIVEEQGGSRQNAKTTLGILTGKRYNNYNEEETTLIADAVTAYSTYAGHLFIYEGIGNIGVAQIREAVEKHIKYADEKGKRPLVVIDYLQILAPYIDEDNPNRHYTDKQAVDKNVLELKRISRDYDLPIIGISSFNRENYTEPVNMAAFKESGAIEYSADVLIGIQYKGMDYKTYTKTDRNGNEVESRESDADHRTRVGKLIKDNVEKAKQGRAQLIEVKVLKNRNGSKGEATLEFYPMFNRFVESIGGTSDALYPVKVEGVQRTVFKPAGR